MLFLIFSLLHQDVLGLNKVLIIMTRQEISTLFLWTLAYLLTYPDVNFPSSSLFHDVHHCLLHSFNAVLHYWDINISKHVGIKLHRATHGQHSVPDDAVNYCEENENVVHSWLLVYFLPLAGLTLRREQQNVDDMTSVTM